MIFDVDMLPHIFDNKDYKLFCGDSAHILKNFPSNFADCVITSPPYWRMRNYDNDKIQGIGDEEDLYLYINKLTNIFNEIKRILKPSGSLWLNIGDKYKDKALQGIPWRVAISLCDNGWIMRNDVIWHQMKGTQSCKDRLRDSYEHIFHFVKHKKYYYDADSIRIKPNKMPTITKDKIISATGVSGKKYRILIQESTDLTKEEKYNALIALDHVLDEIKQGNINDFRMTIRGQQRIWHGNDIELSGRAKELEQKGFYIMKMNSKGHIPSDIWNIVTEDTWRKDNHCAVFPEELLRIPILATSPINGIIIDPFSGTGTTVVAALKHGRKGIGIELNKNYHLSAEIRLRQENQKLSNTLLELL